MKSVLKLRSSHVRIAEQFEASANDMLAAVRQQQLGRDREAQGQPLGKEHAAGAGER